MPRIRQLIREIHRRSVWQVLGVYAVTSWVVYQVVLGLYDGIGLPDWVPATSLVLLLVGLPIVLATALVQEGGPAVVPGRRSEDPASSRSESLARGPSAAPTAAAPAPARQLKATLFTWPRAITGGVLAFAALGLAASGFMGMRALGVGPAATLVSAGMLEKQGRVVLADFTSRASDPALALALTEALRADLSQSAVLEVASRNEVASLLRRMEREPDEAVTAAVARELAIRGGMKAVISGEVSTVGQSYILTAEIAAAQEGNVLASFRETAADSTQLIPAIDRLSKSIREKVGESLRSVRQSPYLMAITTPSLPALKKLVQAYDAENRGESERALSLLTEAIELDPAFAAAHRKRAAILGNFGRMAESVAALEAALEHPGRLTDYERYHAEGLHAFNTGDQSRALTAYRTLLEMDPGDAAALNNISLVYVTQGDWTRARDALQRGVEINLRAVESGKPVFGPTFTGLGLARWNLGDRAGARAAVDLLEAQDPEHPFIPLNRAGYAAAELDLATAQAELARFVRDRSGSPYLQVIGRRTLVAVAATRGRLGEALEQSARAAEIQEREGQTWEDGGLGDGIRIALLHAMGRGDPAAGRRALAEYRARFPVESLAAEDVPYLALVTAYAAVGQVDSARAVADRLSTEPVDWYARSQPYAEAGAEAAIALTEGRLVDAIRSYRRAHEQIPTCPGCFLAPLGMALQAEGQSDSAIAVLTRYVEADWADRTIGFPVLVDGDYLYLGPVLERLAELHEERGQRDRAAEYHRRLEELWRDADPELQPRVQAARRALARLAQERT
jgi:eukaryotic-like serine/threonine-protein kinase